jgi:hypothetical protein
LGALLAASSASLQDGSRSVNNILIQKSEVLFSYLDSAKRLEAYLAAERLPRESPSIRALLKVTQSQDFEARRDPGDGL